MLKIVWGIISLIAIVLSTALRWVGAFLILIVTGVGIFLANVVLFAVAIVYYMVKYIILSLVLVIVAASPIYVPIGIIYLAYQYHPIVPVAGLAFFVLVGSVVNWNSTEIMKTMQQLLRSMYLNTLRSITYQYTTDRPIPAARIVFIATKSEFFKLRNAAHIAGLWFDSTVFEKLNDFDFVYSIIVVPKRNDKKQHH